MKQIKKKLKGVSLFSSAGIGETFFEEIGLNIVVANELLEDRAKLYSKLHPKTEMVTGDILDDSVFKKIIDKSGDKIDFLIATPPCQGMSVAGKNRDVNKMLLDKRNHLIFRVIDFINIKKPNYILIENVPNILKMQFTYKGKIKNIEDILRELYEPEYKIESKILDTSEYSIPQKRQRALIKIYKKDFSWPWPEKSKQINVKEAIGDLPSIESGQKSDIKWHFARKHSKNHILWMQHTPTGKSAFENKIFYPQKSNGEKIRGYITTYRRIRWDEPAPTITMRNDAISSQLNVHPGREIKPGIYSDARVLTILELMILTSLPRNWDIPEDTPEILLRKCIGEGVPPLLLRKIFSKI